MVRPFIHFNAVESNSMLPLCVRLYEGNIFLRVKKTKTDSDGNLDVIAGFKSAPPS